MAIQIPEVKRMNPVEDQTVGRIDDRNLPDGSKEIGQTGNALLGLGKDVMNLEVRLEDQAIDTEKTSASSQLENYYRENLYGRPAGPNGEPPMVGVKDQQGNPEILYKDFDKKMQDKLVELSTNENYSTRMSSAVNQHLSETMNRLDLNKTMEYGNQDAKYQRRVTDSAVDIEKGNLVLATGVIREDDPQSMAMFDTTIGRIRDLRLKNGIKMGGVVPDENGKSFFTADDGRITRVSVDPVVQYQLKRDLSDGIYNAMDNLIKTGNIDSANAIRERYGDYLEPIKKKSIADDFQKANVKQQAYQAVEAARFQDPKSVESIFDKLKPEVRDKAYEIQDDLDRRRKNLEQRSSNANYNTVMSKVLAKMNSSTPYNGISELEADPVYNNAEKYITNPKQREAIMNAVTGGPKNTSEAVRSKMQNLIFGNEDGKDITSMSPQDFAMYTSGMNKSDRARYEGIYEKFRMPDTGPQERARYKAAGADLKNQLVAVGYIVPDQFHRISGTDEIMLTRANNELIDFMDKTDTSHMSPKQMNDYVRQFAVSKQKGKVFEPPTVTKFQSSPGTPPSTQYVAPVPSTQTVKGKTRVEWNKQYLQLNKKPASPQELDKFIRDQE